MGPLDFMKVGWEDEKWVELDHHQWWALVMAAFNLYMLIAHLSHAHMCVRACTHTHTHTKWLCISKCGSTTNESSLMSGHTETWKQAAFIEFRTLSIHISALFYAEFYKAGTPSYSYASMRSLKLFLVVKQLKCITWTVKRHDKNY